MERTELKKIISKYRKSLTKDKILLCIEMNRNTVKSYDRLAEENNETLEKTLGDVIIRYFIFNKYQTKRELLEHEKYELEDRLQKINNILEETER